MSGCTNRGGTMTNGLHKTEWQSAGLCHTMRLDLTLPLWPSQQQRLHAVEWDRSGQQLAVACEDGVTYMYHMAIRRIWKELRGTPHLDS